MPGRAGATLCGTPPTSASPPNGGLPSVPGLAEAEGAPAQRPRFRDAPLNGPDQRPNKPQHGKIKA